MFTYINYSKGYIFINLIILILNFQIHIQFLLICLVIIFLNKLIFYLQFKIVMLYSNNLLKYLLNNHFFSFLNITKN